MEGRSIEAGWWEEKRIMGGEKHLLRIMELIRSLDNVFMRGCSDASLGLLLLQHSSCRSKKVGVPMLYTKFYMLNGAFLLCVEG